MTAPDEKARDLCNPLAGFIPFADLLALHGAITAALIEARRAALEEAAAWHDGQALEAKKISESSVAFGGSDRWSMTAAEHRRAACRHRAMIPTRPDGAAEGAEK